MSLREQKKLIFRQKILDAAALQFKKKGFSETSISDIMKSAKLGVGTFYNYFESKEELLLILLKNIAKEVEDAVKVRLEKNLSSLQILDETTSLMSRLIDENKFVLPLFLSASEHSDKPELLPTRKYTPTFKPIFEIILKRGQADGEIRSDVPADLIAEMFHSIYQAASFSKLDIPFQENIKLKVRLLIDGINLIKN
ncbi:MAG: TetR/AcrR family transcriptional regulator [Selenomonadaceae bacterium]|nr:TetR/AcrR family transcriptional regulator [Selenomonadaceae bacterium]